MHLRQHTPHKTKTSKRAQTHTKHMDISFLNFLIPDEWFMSFPGPALAARLLSLKGLRGPGSLSQMSLSTCKVGHKP